MELKVCMCCQKSGYFLKLNEEGLCKECAAKGVHVSTCPRCKRRGVNVRLAPNGICYDCIAKSTGSSGDGEREKASNSSAQKEREEKLIEAIQTIKSTDIATPGEIYLPCSSGYALQTDGHKIIISIGKNEEIIPISAIQSFSLTYPGVLPGTISFTTAKSAPGYIYLGLGITAALGSSRSFIYSKNDVKIAERFRDVVTNFAPSPAQEAPIPATTGVSVVEELRGLKELLDSGVLTQEEFDAKKKQLLGI